MALGSFKTRARALTSVKAGLGMGVLWMETADTWLCGGVDYFPGWAASRETAAGILLLTHPPRGDRC